MTAELQATAERHALAVMERLGHVGVLAIELFQVGEDLFGNEMAPRVHNSGHWTIEGAATSQFENHLRAICGMELGPTSLSAYSGMVNIIGWVPPESSFELGPRFTFTCTARHLARVASWDTSPSSDPTRIPVIGY